MRDRDKYLFSHRCLDLFVDESELANNLSTKGSAKHLQSFPQLFSVGLAVSDASRLA